jgi:hypothetical protein
VTGPWLAAFVVLWALVLVLAVLVLGVLRRVVPLLDLQEGQQQTVPGFGLPAGTAVPAFEARDRDGEAVTADAIPRPGIVLFIEPGCRPCEKLAEELRSDAANLDGVPLVFVAPDTDEGRALVPPASLIMLQTGRAISLAFQTSVTPHAFLVDANGRLSDNTIPASVADLTLLAAQLGRKDAFVPTAVGK